MKEMTTCEAKVIVVFVLLAIATSTISVPVPNSFVISSILNKINTYRHLHQVSNVSWSLLLQNKSQEWANYLIINNKFEHSKLSYGENIALMSNFYNNTTSILYACDAWYNEEHNYNYANPSFNAGHFSQIVWANTKYIGAGIASTNTRSIIVMMFDPPGNVGNQYKINVFPPKK